MEELILAGSERVLELTAIRDVDFLIPALAAYGAFALEGISLREGEGDVRERDGKGGVLSALSDVGCGGEAPFGAGEAIGHVDR